MFNCLLATFPVYAGFAFVAAKHRLLKIFFGLLWLLFVPNTVYILTDLMHLPKQLSQVTPNDVPILLLEYFFFEIFGIVSFVLSMYPIEQFLQKNRGSIHILLSEAFIVCLNFLIAFGVMLGRFQRTHSWHVLTEPQRVVDDVVRTVQSYEYMVLIGIFGVICNCLYFLFRRPVQAVASFLYKNHRSKRRK